MLHQTPQWPRKNPVEEIQEQLQALEQQLNHLQQKFENKIKQLAALQQDHPETKDEDSYTRLFNHLFLAAAKKGQEKRLKFALDMGAELYTVDENGLNAFQLAALHHQTDILAYLYPKFKGIINQTDLSGQTVLHKAAIAMDVRIIRLLFNIGIDYKIQDKNQQTAYELASPEAQKAIANCMLIRASKQGILSDAKDAVTKGADINIALETGETPLHNAVYYGYKDISTFLVELGAQIEAANKSQATPVNYAEKSPEIKLILQNQLLIDAILREDNDEKLQKILNDGADIQTAKDKNGDSVLHLAIKKANPALLVFLLDQKANLRLQDKQGQIPLHLAMKTHKDKDMLAILLREHIKQGVSLEIADSQNKTPLQLVKESKDEEWLNEVLEKIGEIKAECKWAKKSSSQVFFAVPEQIASSSPSKAFKPN